jgi:hypothetical protein
MRNIAQYPITPDEVKAHIQSYANQEINSGIIGGTGPYICRLVIEYLDDDPDAFEEFLRVMQARELDKKKKSAK